MKHLNLYLVNNMTYKNWIDENYNNLPRLYRRFEGYGYLTPIYNKNEAMEHVDDLYVHLTWSMGGSMRDCWGDTYDVSGEIKPEFTDLDECVALLEPNISYMQYRLKILPLIENDTSNDCGYYGGSVTHGHQQVNLRKLWETI